MKLRKHILRTLLLTFIPLALSAHEGVKVQLAADLMNYYVWRGIECGSVTLQPTVKLAYKGFSVTALGSVGLSDTDDTKEFDFTWQYDWKRLHFAINDNWLDTNPHYFDYGAHSTSHNFEGNIGYDFGLLTADWYTYFAGRDYNSEGHRAYSSWMKFVMPFQWAQLDWQATVGVVPFASDVMYEVDGFAVNLVALKCSKDIRVTSSFSIPLFASLQANPESRKAWMVFGLTLQP